MKHRLFELLQPAQDGDHASRAVDVVIIALILFSIAELVLGSEPRIYSAAPAFFVWSERVILALFTIEYAAKLWSCTTDPRYTEPIRGRLRYAATPGAIIDLLAVAPGLIPLTSLDFRFVRVLRVFRVFRIFKLGRYAAAFHVIGAVFRETREELAVALSFVAVLLLIAACLMHYAEASAQPEHFGSIPSAMWWAIVTLTTVGYGDVYPVTFAGKIIAGIMSVLAIGLVGLPTGILGAGFVNELARRKGPDRPLTPSRPAAPPPPELGGPG